MLKTDNDTVALYTFESGSGATMVDVTGKHNGKILGSTIKRVAGKTGCGKALQFTGAASTTSNYATIPDSTDWRLTQGSVDFWVRLDSPTLSGPQGILTRDAAGNAKGQLSIFRTCAGRIMVRVQTGGTSHHSACSDPVTPGAWQYVVVNFGSPGLKMWIDGKRANFKGQDAIGQTCMIKLECGLGGSTGLLKAEKLPWVIGAASYYYTPKSPKMYDHMKGAIDSLRISKIKRSFQP